MDDSPPTGRSAAVDSLPERLQHLAVQQGCKLALCYLDDALRIQRQLTYHELDCHARSIAAHLQERDLSGQGVVLAYSPGLEFAAAFLGCLYAGAIAIPASPPKPNRRTERLSAILADSEAPCILTDTSLAETILRHASAEGPALDVIDTEELSDHSAAWKSVMCSPEQLAFLQYTSGSTRIPLGVQVSHANLTANLEVIRDLFEVSAESVFVSWLPAFHDMGLIGNLLESIWLGGTVYFLSPASFVQDPLRWLHAVSRYRGTFAVGPNFGYQACVDAAASADISQLDLSSWRIAGNGAEPVRPETVEQFRKTFTPAGFLAESLFGTYSLAEATLAVTGSNGAIFAQELVLNEFALSRNRVEVCDLTHVHSKRVISSGHPGRGVEVRIVDPSACRESLPGEVGEIWVAGESVAQGYWKKSEESEQTFSARLYGAGEQYFLRTGDLGFIHLRELFVTGRRKDILLIRGATYYPQDLEYTVSKCHPALRVDAGAVIGLEAEGRVRVVVVNEVQRKERRTLDQPAIFDAIRRAVARDHELMLDGIILLKPYGLPRTSSGKVQRSMCGKLLQEGRLACMGEWWAPDETCAAIVLDGEPLTQPGVLERHLVDWLQRELAVVDLGWKTPLIELGVDSLKAVELSNRLSRALHYNFSASLIFDCPTVSAVAGFIRDQVLESGLNGEQSAVAKRDTATWSGDVHALSKHQLDAALHESILAVQRELEVFT